MVTRILLLLLLLTSIIAVWRVARPPTALRVDPRLKALSRRHKAMARALELRKRVARLLVKGRAAGAELVLADLDGLLDVLADQLDLRDQVTAVEGDTSRIDAQSQQLLGHFQRAHDTVVELARDQLAFEAEPLHQDLERRTAELRDTLEAVEEV